MVKPMTLISRLKQFISKWLTKDTWIQDNNDDPEYSLWDQGLMLAGRWRDDKENSRLARHRKSFL